METRTREEITREVEQTRQAAKRAIKNAGEIWTGRNAIASAWRSTKKTYLRTHDKVADTAYVADKTVRENVYVSAGIVLGIGAILGYFFANKLGKSERKKHGTTPHRS